MFKKRPPKTRMEAQLHFILTQAGVPANEVHQCLTWAFGPNYFTEPPFPNWTNYWNKYHPSAFKISPKDKFVELIFVIGFTYEMQKRKGQGTRSVKVS